VQPEAAYATVIERGGNPVNDRIFDYIKGKLGNPGRWIDIGCNTGALLLEVPNGVGVEASHELATAARAKGLTVFCGPAEYLPFASESFDTAVLSCVLEQCADPRAVLTEAERIARRVIGVNPIPGASVWGSVGGWVRSVIPEAEMQARGYRTERMDGQRYYFESNAG
jgi:hypothetical protein